MPTGAVPVLLVLLELAALSPCVASAHLPGPARDPELGKIGQLETFEYDEPSCRLVGETAVRPCGVVEGWFICMEKRHASAVSMILYIAWCTRLEAFVFNIDLQHNYHLFIS